MSYPDFSVSQHATLASRLQSLAGTLESCGFRIEASLVAAAGLSLRQQGKLGTLASNDRGPLAKKTRSLHSSPTVPATAEAALVGEPRGGD